jgi:hypothetical protein
MKQPDVALRGWERPEQDQQMVRVNKCPSLEESLLLADPGKYWAEGSVIHPRA